MDCFSPNFLLFLVVHKKNIKNVNKFNFLLAGCTLFPGSQVFHLGIMDVNDWKTIGSLVKLQNAK